MPGSGTYHSVTLDKDKCNGCINCIKRCPTEAIRVRNGKAKIIKERCIDCGECIRVCPNHAKKAIVDSLDMLKNFKYNIALPAPSLYGQFKKQSDINVLLSALLEIGFDDVFEVSRAADVVTEATMHMIAEGNLKKPVISSACPAVVKLIRIRFPNLIDNILPLHAPMEVAALLARQRAPKQYKSDEVGVFFISPCAAKVTVAKQLTDEKMKIDGVLSIADIYVRMLSVMSRIKEPKKLSDTTKYGINWAASGGEVNSLSDKMKGISTFAVDGIFNVIKILEQMEDDQLKGVDFVEINACYEGCIGGALSVENAYLSKSYLKNVKETGGEAEIKINLSDIMLKEKLDYIPVLRLSDDMMEAMAMLDKIDEVQAELPGIDCGSCGSPSCRALAEDVVRGFTDTDDCIFKIRENVRTLINQMLKIESHLPPPLRTDNYQEREDSDDDD